MRGVGPARRAPCLAAKKKLTDAQLAEVREAILVRCEDAEDVALRMGCSAKTVYRAAPGRKRKRRPRAPEEAEARAQVPAFALLVENLEDVAFGRWPTRGKT